VQFGALHLFFIGSLPHCTYHCALLNTVWSCDECERARLRRLLH